MLDAMKSLTDEMLVLRNKELDLDKTFDSAQAKPLPGPTKSNPPRTSDLVQSDPSEVQPMDIEPYGPQFPPRSTQMPQSERGVHSDLLSYHSEQASNSEYYQARPKHKKHSDKRKHKSKPIHQSQSSAEEDESSAHSRGFTQSQPKVPPEPQPQASSDPVLYREVDMKTSPPSGRLYPVSAVKECNQNGGKCKISWVLQLPVSCTQASPEVEASIDLNRLNTFLHVEKFKMETQESIRTSLILGEWVSSIDLSDAYLHIPIHPLSRKYLRFCHRSQVFQFTSLPFGLAKASQVFTMIVKEAKLMALSRGLRLHQYLDDWLISLRRKPK